MEKLSISKCRAILEKNGGNYTDEEILKIRDFLYNWVKLAEELYETKKRMEKETSSTHPPSSLKEAEQ